MRTSYYQPPNELRSACTVRNMLIQLVLTRMTFVLAPSNRIAINVISLRMLLGMAFEISSLGKDSMADRTLWRRRHGNKYHLLCRLTMREKRRVQIDHVLELWATILDPERSREIPLAASKWTLT